MDIIYKELIIFISVMIFCFIGKLFENFDVLIIYLLVRLYIENIIRE